MFLKLWAAVQYCNSSVYHCCAVESVLDLGDYALWCCSNWLRSVQLGKGCWGRNMPIHQGSERRVALLKILEDARHDRVCLSCWLEIIAQWVPKLSYTMVRTCYFVVFFWHPQHPYTIRCITKSRIRVALVSWWVYPSICLANLRNDSQHLRVISKDCKCEDIALQASIIAKDNNFETMQ